MEVLPLKLGAELIEDIRAKLSEKPRKKGAAYALIVGAGFSHGIVPLTKELLHEHIGSFYYPEGAAEGAGQRTRRQCQRLSRDYWKEFNGAGLKSSEPSVELDDQGLPLYPSIAYQELFTYRTANALFASAPGLPEGKFMARLRKSREAVDPPPPPRTLAGEKFVKEFLQDVLDRGGYLSQAGTPREDYCTTGRSDLNAAHFFLASLLELQQSGELWELRPFCRTIFTTNFDTLMQNALQFVNLLYCITDRPERGLDSADFPEHDRALHLVYTHGSILRHNAASTTAELSDLTRKNAEKIAEYLKSKDVLVIGYGGWDDSLMSALTRCDKTCHRIYWCNVYPADKAEANLAPAVRDLIRSYAGQAYYVPLGAAGAGGFMRDLYSALAPNNAIPPLFRDPFKVFKQRFAGLKLGNTVFGADDLQTPAPRTLPLPRLERSVQLMHWSALAMLSYASTCFGYGKDDAPSISNSIAAGRESSLLERGFLLALSGNTDQAVTLWTHIVESAPPGSKDLAVNEAAIAANYIGVVRSREGKLELAVAAHTRACELVFANPTLHVDSLNYRGAAHQQMGQTDAAIEDFSRAIAIWNDHREAVSVGSIGRALIYRGLTRQWSGQSGAQDDFNEARQLKKLPEECKRLFAFGDTE